MRMYTRARRDLRDREERKRWTEARPAKAACLAARYTSPIREPFWQSSLCVRERAEGAERRGRRKKTIQFANTAEQVCQARVRGRTL